jgi:serine/threonine-protein kinase ULK/ATG1
MAQRSNELRKKIENYSYGLNDHLHLGHKSNTFKGLNEKTTEQVAIKVVDLRSKDRENDQLNTEIEILKKLQHPNLIHCMDVYSTVNNCYIITEFCDQGDLDNRITTRGKVT